MFRGTKTAWECDNCHRQMTIDGEKMPAAWVSTGDGDFCSWCAHEVLQVN